MLIIGILAAEIDMLLCKTNAMSWLYTSLNKFKIQIFIDLLLVTLSPQCTTNLITTFYKPQVKKRDRESISLQAVSEA